ncbi:conserved hypothetical protein [Lausannevirus]|uniref:Uncharacterized protein n=1 Tax=Lausannevirus TaxID=999883 RepID=F2WM13_9VIRU|nr:hypothetical protein LAU_0436 [Lausannevirus]AEA07286.1 conserved hypothetical protein [Lausannevirus]
MGSIMVQTRVFSLEGCVFNHPTSEDIEATFPRIIPLIIMSSAELISLLPEEFTDNLFSDYYEQCRTSDKVMRPLTPTREKMVLVFFLEMLLRNESKSELVETVKTLDVQKFMDILNNNKNYKGALYLCASF